MPLFDDYKTIADQVSQNITQPGAVLAYCVTTEDRMVALPWALAFLDAPRLAVVTERAFREARNITAASLLRVMQQHNDELAARISTEMSASQAFIAECGNEYTCATSHEERAVALAHFFTALFDYTKIGQDVAALETWAIHGLISREWRRALDVSVLIEGIYQLGAWERAQR